MDSFAHRVAPNAPDDARLDASSGGEPETAGAGISQAQCNANAGGASLPPLPWLEWTPGDRVVVRYRLDDGLHDALGYLVETDVDHVVVETRRGRVRVEAITMVTGKRVPPPPTALS